MPPASKASLLAISGRLNMNADPAVGQVEAHGHLGVALVGPVAAAEPAADAARRVVDVEVHGLVEVRLGAELVHVLVVRFEAHSHAAAPYLTARSSAGGGAAEVVGEGGERGGRVEPAGGRHDVDRAAAEPRAPASPAAARRSTAARQPARPTKQTAAGLAATRTAGRAASTPARYSLAVQLGGARRGPLHEVGHADAVVRAARAAGRGRGSRARRPAPRARTGCPGVT